MCPLRTPGDQPGEDCRPGLLESQQNGSGEGAVVGPLQVGVGGNVLRPVHDELQEKHASGGDGAKISGSGTWALRPIAGLGDPRQVFGKLRRSGPFARFHSGSTKSRDAKIMDIKCFRPRLHSPVWTGSTRLLEQHQDVRFYSPADPDNRTSNGGGLRSIAIKESHRVLRSFTHHRPFVRLQYYWHHSSLAKWESVSQVILLRRGWGDGPMLLIFGAI
jgi:hypothetical protein